MYLEMLPSSSLTPATTSAAFTSSPLKLYTCGAMNDPSYGLSDSVKPRSQKSWKPKGVFRFFDLPSELRQDIYELALIFPHTIDLDPQNRRITARLNLLLTCRKIYSEAFSVFYRSHTFRIFPTHPGFLNNKEPLLMRLPRRARRAITTLELRLGPGWSKPPKCQSLTRSLWLKDCVSVRLLKVFVELDPSHDIFKGYRKSDTFYTVFASEMLKGILHLAPSVVFVQFDAWPSVRKQDALMTTLLDVAESAGKLITWGPLRGWDTDISQDDNCDMRRIEECMTALAI